jgi:uncharacterized protein YsxB (DUF464 family)
MSSPGVPVFLNESLLKIAIHNADTFRKKLDEVINCIVNENIPKITIKISNEIIEKSKEGILDFTYRIQINHRDFYEILFKNLELSIKLLTEKYKEKLAYDNIIIDKRLLNRDEHTILVGIKIE